MWLAKIRVSYLILLLILIVPAFIGTRTAAQIDNQLANQATTNEDSQRDLIRAKLLEARQKRQNQKKTNNRKLPAPIAQTEFDNRFIGVTLWRLVPATRSLTHPVRVGDLIPESINLDTPLVNGDKVRLTIEAPREGYLYIIDSEQYANGEKNIALIFPTTRINGGNNRVVPGRTVGLPSLTDNPPYLELEIKDHQISENLRLIIADEPIAELPIGKDAMMLSPDQLAQYGKWEVETHQIPLTKSGQLQSSAENEAEQKGDQKRGLLSNDPLPQSALLANKTSGKVVIMNLPLKLSNK